MKRNKHRDHQLIRRFYLFRFLRGMMFLGAVLVPFFTQQGGISLFQIQLLQSWYMFWVVSLEVPTGAVADYLGRKHSLLLGSLISGMGFFLYSFMTSFSMFLVGEFILAIGMALVSGADEAWVYDTLKEQGREKSLARKIFGKARVAYLLGLIVASPIGSFVAASQGIGAPLIWSAVSLVLSGLVVATLPEPKRFNQSPESQRYLTIIVDGFRYLFNHSKLMGVALEAVIIASAGYFVIWLYQPVLMELGVPIALFGWFNIALISVQMLISNNFQILDQRFSPRRYRWLNILMICFGFGLVAAWPSVWTLIIFLLTAGGFGLTHFFYLSSIMNELVPSDKRATVMSAISMMRYFAVFLLNPLVGWGADASLRWTFVGLALLPWLAAILLKDEQKAKEKLFILSKKLMGKE